MSIQFIVLLTWTVKWIILKNDSEALHAWWKQVIIEVLSGKHVLLFITDLKIPTEELSILKEMFNESRKQPLRPERQYEVVWLHVKDDSIKWDVEEEDNFKGLRKKMPWYSLSHSELDPGVIRFIKKEWKFNNNPLLVLLDPHGEVVNPTEFIWCRFGESMAFPFVKVCDLKSNLLACLNS